MKNPQNKQTQKIAKKFGTTVSPGQQIIRGTKPSAVNSHTRQQATNADMAQRQQNDMSQIKKGTTNALNRVMKAADVDISGAEKAKIFDQLDPKNNQSQRSKKLGY
jgi:hypothetical protein